MQLEWTSGSIRVPCPVCGRTDEQTLLAVCRVDWQADAVSVVRCRGCRSVVMSAVLPPTAYTEEGWDTYVESVAGIEAIANTLAKVGAKSGARFLDVGCGYGFGLDLARHLWGWQGVGLDPSVAARKGRAELGLDIRPGTLADAFESDERFDVILASEVLEHVPEPSAFLEEVRARLEDDGAFLMTTPNGAVVREGTSMTVLTPVLSVGLHRFAIEVDALAQLLHHSGFHAETWSDAATIYAVASPTPEGIQNVRRDAEVPLAELADYCAARGSRAAPGSALAVGMAMRHVKFVAFGSGVSAAADGLPAMRRAIVDRYGLDLDDPAAMLASEQLPAVLAPACYFAGIIATHHTGDLDAAERLFAVAAKTGTRQFDEYGSYVFPEVALFESLSRGEAALVRARRDPASVAAALDELDAAAARGACGPETVQEFRARVASVVEARLGDPTSLEPRSLAARIRGRTRRAMRRLRRSGQGDRRGNG